MAYKSTTNNEQQSLAAKELQKFLHRVEVIWFIPKDMKSKPPAYPMLCLVLGEQAFVDFKDYGIHGKMVDLLDTKYPILSIHIHIDQNIVTLAITDVDSGLTFSLPNQPITEALLTFLQATKYDEKIPIVLGQLTKDSFVFDRKVMNNVLLVLAGIFGSETFVGTVIGAYVAYDYKLFCKIKYIVKKCG